MIEKSNTTGHRNTTNYTTETLTGANYTANAIKSKHAAKL